jgi:hypothetical protein
LTWLGELRSAFAVVAIRGINLSATVLTGRLTSNQKRRPLRFPPRLRSFRGLKNLRNNPVGGGLCAAGAKRRDIVEPMATPPRLEPSPEFIERSNACVPCNSKAG